MAKRVLVLIAVVVLLLVPPGVIFAQGPTPTSTSAFGDFGTLFSGTATPTSSAATTDSVKQALAQSNYVVVSSGNWFDAQGKALSDSAYVMMVGAAADPKSDAGVRQIASGFSALRTQFPKAATYHVLLLNAPFIYDASTTSRALELLGTQLVTPDAFIKDVLAQMGTINMAQGGVSTTVKATAVPTRASTSVSPTRKPTAANAGCNVAKDKARLWVKNGYTGTMRFTVGGGEWGTHDFDIPADSQYHFIDMPPGDKYTYSASIPGVGKASAKLPPYSAGQCYYLTFQP